MPDVGDVPVSIESLRSELDAAQQELVLAHRRIRELQDHVEMRPAVPCLACWGAGEVTRQSRTSERLFCWPCPWECAAPRGASMISMHSMRGQAGKSRR